MNVNELCNEVMQLDLDLIKSKLMHVESGEGWSLEKANAVEKEYRRFLCLMKLYPDDDTAPLVDVDTFWHYHILDTMKYALDCEQVFGYFLHHYPYVGMHGEDDEQFRLDSGDRMRELYEATFGEAYPGSLTESVPQAERKSLDGQATGSATAWCAGPHIQAAWCAGPHTKTAWCAGPRIGKLAAAAEGATSGATAWCAGPRIGKVPSVSKESVNGATAWCAGPHVEPAAHEVRPMN